MMTAYGYVGTYATPPIPICPQEPWEAQEEAHRDRSRVKFSFCGRPTVETRPDLRRWGQMYTHIQPTCTVLERHQWIAAAVAAASTSDAPLLLRLAVRLVPPVLLAQRD